MTRCDCCNTKFTWWSLLKKNSFYGGLKCRICGCKHRIDFASRFSVTLLSVVPFMMFGLILSPFESIFLNILVALLIFILGMLLTPFVVNYKLTRR
ncbi:TIGR04104 family putative zinc finger protein [Halobacillus litoralis]|uniref:TIGR04104 family putative zinc finger protein n=1 Tax=Halobacillus litoralis TaxID=45668 RepID=UPI001CFCD8D3